MRRLIRIMVVLTTFALVSGLIPAGRAASPFGNTTCSGARPGAELADSKGNLYTQGFVFKGVKGTDVAYYVSTIGSLILDTPGTKVWAPGKGPVVKDGDKKAIGRFVYASYTDTPEFTTFGLVRLNKGIKPKTSLCHFGGPTGMYTGSDITLTLEFFGQGDPSNIAARARTTVATGGGDTYWTEGPITFGDEGAPFITSGGKAVGYFDGGIGGGTGGAGFAVTMLTPKLKAQQKKTGIKLTLLKGALA